MEKIVFKNKPNDCKIIDGQIFWISRSVAVVGILIFRNILNHKSYVLLEKRSSIMDQPNKWCVPCGYIDWDEDGWESLTREVYEETSFYLPRYKEHIFFDNDKQPFYVNTKPTENRQNISLRYGMVLNFNGDIPIEIEEYKNEEISQIKFVSLNEISNYEMAFNHDVAIKSCVEHFNKNILNFHL